MRILFWLLAPSSWLLAGVNGTVTNVTTGKPQPGVIISLVQPGQNGMQTIGSAKSDADGKFTIDKDLPPGPALVQALFGGATYNTMLQPGAPTTGVAVKVFDSTSNPEIGKAGQHMILLEPGPSGVQVSETFLFDNRSQLTFSDPAKGSVQFYQPKGAAKPQVTINAPGGMPIPREAEKTAQPGVFKINYPIKPGQTRFDVSYTLPVTDTYDGKTLDVPTFLVTPQSVKLAGDGIDDLGEEPQTRAHTYRVRSASFTVKMEGTGSLRTAEAPADEDNGSPKIEIAPARVYTRMGWVLGLTFAILALGGVMLFRKGAA
jgi:hypothetical protein